MSYKDKITRYKYSKGRSCTICNILKIRSDFNSYQHRCKSCEAKKLYKCWKCKEIKEEDNFPKDPSRKLGISSMCKVCKAKIPKKKTETHYISKRKSDKIRSNRPERKLRRFIKDCFKRLRENKESTAASLLGFTQDELKTKFPVIPEGYEIDHCIPLSWFKVGTPISISCSLSNLQLLPGAENARKRNFYYHKPSDLQYFTNCLKYIDNKYLDLIKI